MLKRWCADTHHPQVCLAHLLDGVQIRVCRKKIKFEGVSTTYNHITKNNYTLIGVACPRIVRFQCQRSTQDYEGLIRAARRICPDLVPPSTILFLQKFRTSSIFPSSSLFRVHFLGFSFQPGLPQLNLDNDGQETAPDLSLV